MLTPKQQRFVAEYLFDLNATQAAIRAGYSARTATKQGSRLLTNVHVSEAVKAAQIEQSQRLQISADEIRGINADIARLDPAEMFDPAGVLLHISQMPPRVRRAIRSLKVVRKNLTAGDGVMDVTLEVQFWDKGAAIQREYQHHGLLVERVEFGAKDGLVEKLLAGRKRAAAARRSGAE